MIKSFVRSLLCVIAGASLTGLRAESAWSWGSCAPADWTALSDDILLNVKGTSASGGASGYDSGDLAVLTDGKVPTSAPDKAGIFGFRNNENVSWTFSVPKTLQEIRISTSYLTSTSFDGLHVAKVEVMTSDGSGWIVLAGEVEYKGESTAGKINYAVLSNGSDPVAENVTGLKITFGTCETGFANYYAEIEAVGFSEATGPIIDAFGITPARTRANVVGTIVDVGTDATACDVYLSLDGADAVKIAEGVTDAFDFRLQDLTADTTYAYELSVSNNATPAKGIVRSGEFTTLSADASTALWIQGECDPADWKALPDNVLGGLDASGKSGISSYASQDMTKLTDGVVPVPAKGSETVGCQNNATISWAFDRPKTIEKLRLSAMWESTAYNGVSVNAVHVKYQGSAAWEELNVPTVKWTGGSKLVQTETLSDIETGFLAQGVVGLKITFGAQKAAVANYYAEIEAVGSAEATGPVIGDFDIAVGKTKAEITGTIVDVGTDATECDVYFSLTNGPAVRIARGREAADTFEYQLRGLTAGTAYSYELSVVNDAKPSKETVLSGEFTTVDADASTAIWTQGECDPGDWTALERNILGGLDASEESGISPYASKDMTNLTDRVVPVPAKGAETVGFGNGGTIAWTFDGPKTIESIRFSALWENMSYNGVSVDAVQVKYPDSEDWIALNVPTVKWTGGSELLQMETLSDAETGYLAADAVGLKIVFGAQKAAVANYYAEIEAVERKATDVLSVSGDPMAYGTVDPDYGKHVGYVAGVEYTLAAPSVWMSEDELTQSVCIGCVVTNIGGAEIASETYSGDGETRSVTFVYPECENGVEAVWRWEVLNKVAVTATDGGSVSSSGGWYAYGQGLAVTATPDDGCMFLQWVDRRTGAVLGTDPSLAIAVETPLDVSAVFMSESEIVFDPSVVDYTPIIRGLVVNAEEGAVITMQPGVYPLATPLAVDKAVTLQGAADGGTVLKGAYVRNSAENNVSQLSVSGGATLDHIAITGGSGASPLWNAPGIGVSISSGTLSWCAITNNVYDGVGNSYGVGVYVDIASNDMVTITHCRICDNRSNAVYNHSKGVGLYAAGAGTLLMDNCLVAGNRTEKGTAGSPDVAGGGLYLSLSDALIVNCTIVDNLHGNRGGGVAVYGDDEALYTPSLCNCIIAGNTADEDPCVYGPDVSATRLSDNGDVAPEIFNACSNNLVRAGLTPFGVNGIVADPCFEPGSYRIQPSSPAHNAGLKLPWMTWTVDLDGNPRFRRTIDIGCYECFEAPMGTMIYMR